MTFQVVLFLIVMALGFEFMNGFNDAANSIATIVSTGAMRPQYAVIWAALFNFISFLVFGVAVATTIGRGIVAPSVIDSSIVFGGLFGATTWQIITWRFGIPSSSSHALVGGLAGAAVAKGGTGTLVASGFLKTSAAIVLSPTFGFMLGLLLMFGTSWVCAKSTPRKVERRFRGLHYISAALYSLGHGGNDAQKTMGVIWMLLLAAGLVGARDPLPMWVVLVCQTAMGLGTLFGGWRIVRTMGTKITKLRPLGGFCASASGAATLFLATGLGVPVSTTHTITGSIVGVGSVRSLSAVRWGVAGSIVWAWILTIPCSGFIAAVAWFIGKTFLQ